MMKSIKASGQCVVCQPHLVFGFALPPPACHPGIQRHGVPCTAIPPSMSTPEGDWFSGGASTSSPREGGSSRPSRPSTGGSRSASGRGSGGQRSEWGQGRDSASRSGSRDSRGGGGGGRSGAGGGRVQPDSSRDYRGSRDSKPSGDTSRVQREPVRVQRDTLAAPRVVVSGSAQDQAALSFAGLLAHLQKEQQEGEVVRKDSWEVLFRLMQNEGHAEAAVALLLGDAGVREAGDWDWDTQGYGQTVQQLVAASAGVGAMGVAEQLLDSAATLHLNLGSKELVAGCLRRLVGAEAGSGPVIKLFERERQLRGKNTHMACHELSRVLRREEDTTGVRALLQQVEDGQADMKEDLIEDLTVWLSRRGVQI